MDCKDKHEEKSSQICCDYCPKGKHVLQACNLSSLTVCKACEHGNYLDDRNFVYKCLRCKDCHDTDNKRMVSECFPDKNRQCECKSGYYCDDKECEHCRPVTMCSPGSGVKVKASPRINTFCEPCRNGTFNNVKDSHSPCKNHTRCEDKGQVLKINGTATSDVVCTPHYYCPWMLPAGLWAGLVLTLILILLYVIYRKAKRRSHMTDIQGVRVDVPEKPETCVALVTCALSNGHCQESCEGEDDKLLEIPCTQDSAESECHLRTPVMASDQFGLSNHINGKAGFHTSSLLRTISEPQEDEWGGT